MSTLNSYAEFVKGTYSALIVDCALKYPELTKELNRDLQRICSAIDEHGVRFTLDTMPSFRKHFDTCLSKGRLTASQLLHFGVDKKQGTIPRLFRGLVLRVFDRTGALKLQPDPDAVRWIRQLLGVVRKLRLTSSIKDQGNAVRDFLKLDLEVKDGTLNWADPSLFDSEDAARLSFTDYRQDHLIEQESLLGLETTNSDLPHGLLVKVQQVADLITSQLGVFSPLDWRFRHGPGAVADQRWGDTKYRFRNWPHKLESVFPYADFAHANYAQVEMESVSEATRKGFYQERPAKLHAVPKTLTTQGLSPRSPSAINGVSKQLSLTLLIAVSIVSSEALSTSVDKTSMDTLLCELPIASHTRRLTCRPRLILSPAGTSNVSSDARRPFYQPYRPRGLYGWSRRLMDCYLDSRELGSTPQWAMQPRSRYSLYFSCRWPLGL